MIACPSRQVLLVRNALFFSGVYLSRFLPHRGRKERLKNSLHRWLICRSVKSADVVMTPSEAMMSELKGYVAFPSGKARVNHYGVHSWKPARKGCEGVGAESGRRGHRLLYTSLYAEHKNLSTLLNALIQLVEGNVDCHLVTSADPNWVNARSTSTWREDARIAADPRIASRVDFTGVLSGEETMSLYESADVFVYPSVVESFGHPLVEAMAAGLPIVAADTPINRELCGDGALYFSPFDPRECAQQIRLLLENPKLRTALIERASSRCKDFQWTNHVAKLLDVFAER